MSLTVDTITPGDVIMDPNNKTTMWRALEVDRGGNRVRVVRSNKEGGIHGLVRDPSGSWKPTPDIKKFTVIGHFTGTDMKGAGARAAAAAGSQNTGAKPTGANRRASHQAPATPPAPAPTNTEAPDMTQFQGNSQIFRFMEVTLRSMADGLKAMQNE